MKVIFSKLLTLLLVVSVLCALLPAMRTRALYGNGYVGGQHGDGVGIYAHGVDLSSWQGGEVDFARIREQGYRFVILRAGFSVHMDRYFERNYTAAKEAGLDVGVYLYSYADTVNEVLQEVEALKTWLSGKKLEYPVYYDMEEPETHGEMSASALTELSMAFLDAMAHDGWLVGLYSCKSWLDNKLQTDIICEKYECWMALYLPSGGYATYDQYDDFCGLWQYSSTGSVDGVPGNVDMNVAFRNYPAICMQYGLNGYAPSAESISLFDSSEPPLVIATGENITISGRVVSHDGELKDVTAAVFDSFGNMRGTAFAVPHATIYDIDDFGSRLRFSSLPQGEYTYRLTASNNRGTCVLKQVGFTVSDGGILTIGVTAPENLTAGRVYVPQGQIYASTVIENVYISVSDERQTELLAVSVAPKTDVYALPTLSAELRMQTLPMGQYRYCVTVTTQLGTQTVLDELFHIWVSNDPITLRGNVLNSEYPPGELCELSGEVVSTYSVLRSVTVSIYGEDGSAALMQGEATGAVSVQLRGIGEELPLSELSYGTYLCVVEALNDAGPVRLLEKEFVIRPDGLSLCRADLPSVLFCGDSFHLTGAVASDYSPLEIVSVCVLDGKGQIVFDAAYRSGMMVCDLSDFSAQLRFSDLPVGEYTLRIGAKNKTTYQILCDSGFCVTDRYDRISWLGAHCSANGISYAGCDTLQLYGTLQSSQSNILRVGAQVITRDGELMNEAELLPSSQLADIQELNNLLRLSALAAGNYRLVITAENASGELLMLDEPFSVSQCVHRNVRSGVVYEQRCDRMGVICDSRCADCGERTQVGDVLPSDPHNWDGSSCLYCAQERPKIFLLSRTQFCRHMGRYAITVCRDGQWYALSIQGETVPIDAPDQSGLLSLSADLLWTADIQAGALSFSNHLGLRLHLDSDRIAVSAGTTNAMLKMDIPNNSDGFVRISSIDPSRLLCFADGKFCVGEPGSDIILFELPLSGE